MKVAGITNPEENSLNRELVYKLSMRVIWPMNVAHNGFSGVLPDTKMTVGSQQSILGSTKKQQQRDSFFQCV